MSSFWKALSVFIGTIIGVGIFGLPWVALKSGFFVLLFYFLLLGTIALVVHLTLGEVIVNTPGKHRFPGYVRKYLGGNWAKVSFGIMCASLFGAQIAYLMVGGSFLSSLLSPYFGGDPLFYVLVFFTAGSILIYKDIRSVSWTEFLVLFFFFFVLGVFSIKSINHIKIEYLLGNNLKFFIYPYGIVLFSLWGTAILPEVKEILGNSRKELRKIIFIGITTAAVVYVVFAGLVLGVSGQETSQDVFSGLAKIFGTNIARIGFFLGIITCFTSFLTLGLTLKKIFWYDMRVPEKISWAIVCFLPLALIFAGANHFIDILSVTGAVAVGFEGVMITLLYRAVLKKKLSKTINPLYFLLSLFLILGVFAEIFYFILK